MTGMHLPRYCRHLIQLIMDSRIPYRFFMWVQAMNTVRRKSMTLYASNAPRNSKKHPVIRNSRNRKSPANCGSSRRMNRVQQQFFARCAKPVLHVLVCPRDWNAPLLRVDWSTRLILDDPTPAAAIISPMASNSCGMPFRSRLHSAWIDQSKYQKTRKSEWLLEKYA